MSRSGLSQDFLIVDSMTGQDAVHSAKAFNDEEMKWRQTRHDRLLKEDGWLSLVGLDWLQRALGDQPVGVDLACDRLATDHLVHHRLRGRWFIRFE